MARDPILDELWRSARRASCALRAGEPALAHVSSIARARSRLRGSIVPRCIDDVVIAHAASAGWKLRDDDAARARAQLAISLDALVTLLDPGHGIGER